MFERSPGTCRKIDNSLSNYYSAKITFSFYCTHGNKIYKSVGIGKDSPSSIKSNVLVFMELYLKEFSMMMTTTQLHTYDLDRGCMQIVLSSIGPNTLP